MRPGNPVDPRQLAETPRCRGARKRSLATAAGRRTNTDLVVVTHRLLTALPISLSYVLRQQLSPRGTTLAKAGDGGPTRVLGADVAEPEVGSGRAPGPEVSVVVSSNTRELIRRWLRTTRLARLMRPAAIRLPFHPRWILRPDWTS